MRDRPRPGSASLTAILAIAVLGALAILVSREDVRRATVEDSDVDRTHVVLRNISRPGSRLSSSFSPRSEGTAPTSSPIQESVRRSLTTLPPSLPQLKESLQHARRLLVVQTDSRFRGAGRGRRHPTVLPQAEGKNFSSSYVAVSILSLTLWAKDNGYGYIFLEQHGAPCVNARGTVDLAMIPVWCKVPHILYAFHLARLAAPHLEALLYVDTDTQPGGKFSMDDFLARMEREEGKSFTQSAHHIIVGQDSAGMAMYWGSNVLKKSWPAVYGTGLNSGVILVRTTDTARRLLEWWWTESPYVPSPFERRVLAAPCALAVLTLPTPSVESVNLKHVRKTWNSLSYASRDALLQELVPAHLKSILAIRDCGSQVGLASRRTMGAWSVQERNGKEGPLVFRIGVRSRGAPIERALRWFDTPEGRVHLQTAMLPVVRAASGAPRIELDKTEFEVTFENKTANFSEVDLFFVHNWPGDQERLQWLQRRSPTEVWLSPISGPRDPGPWLAGVEIHNQHDLAASRRFSSKGVLWHWCANAKRKIQFSAIHSRELQHTRAPGASDEEWDLETAFAPNLLGAVPSVHVEVDWRPRAYDSLVEALRAGDFGVRLPELDSNASASARPAGAAVPGPPPWGVVGKASSPGRFAALRDRYLGSADDYGVVLSELVDAAMDVALVDALRSVQGKLIVVMSSQESAGPLFPVRAEEHFARAHVSAMAVESVALVHRQDSTALRHEDFVVLLSAECGGSEGEMELVERQVADEIVTCCAALRTGGAACTTWVEAFKRGHVWLRCIHCT